MRKGIVMATRTKTEHPYLLMLSLVLLTLSLFFGGFLLYILPNVIWDLDYNVPDVLGNLRFALVDTYGYSDLSSRMITLIIFFIPAAVFGYLNYRLSNYLEQMEILRTEDMVPENPSIENEGMTLESVSWFFKMFVLAIVIVALLFGLQWLLSTPVARIPV